MLNVWPTRYVTGWDGVAEEMPGVYPVVDYRVALEATYTSDAHVCPAIIPEVEHQPRLRYDTSQAVLDEVRFRCLLLDIDGPDHVADEAWKEERIEKVRQSPILGNAIFYHTRGGIRALYELPKPLTIPEYLRLHAQVRHAYSLIGVEVDRLTDWTRCYRLPFVVRDGVLQDLPYYDNPNPMLLTHLLPQCDEGMTIFQRAAAKAEATSPFKVEGIHAAAKMGRNQTLFRLAAALRDFRWMDRETLEVMVRSVNEECLETPLGEGEVAHVIDSAWKRYEPTRGLDTLEEEVTHADRPEIVLKAGMFHLVQQQAISALADTEGVYVRGGRLVRILDAAIQDLPQPLIKGLLASAAHFQKYKAGQGEVELVDADPPPDLVAAVYHAGEYPLPQLRGIVRTPSLRPDGSVLYEPGYDPSTGMFVHLDDSEGLAPLSPDRVGSTLEEAQAALARLKVLFAEFPFAEPEHMSVTLAAMMTPVLRTAISGPCPLFLFDSNTPGSGKTIQADVVSIVVSGKEAPRMSLTKEEETEKRVTAILEMGTPVVLIDNVGEGQALGGAALDALLTSDMWMGRVLGKSTMRVLPNLAVWMATGNNMRVKGDLARRALRSYIDPGMENPEKRTFAIADLRQHVRQRRNDIIADILTIARARHLSGYKGPAMGSFESWSYWVRDSLVWVGAADPVLTQRTLRESDQTGAWRLFLEAAFQIFNRTNKEPGATDVFTAREVQNVVLGINKYAGPDDAYTGIIHAAHELIRDLNSLSSIGATMKQWSHRVLGGYRLVPERQVGLRGPTYRVLSVPDNEQLSDNVVPFRSKQ